MNKGIIHKLFSTVLVILLAMSGCATREKHLSEEEELQMKQFREEGSRRSPQEQRVYECSEWHMRHPGSSYEPPECETSPTGGNFDPMRQQRKNVDEIIDRQLKEQSEKK